MDELLKKIPSNLSVLKRFTISTAAKEMSALSEPCYYPKTKKVYHEFLNLLKITDKDFKAFIKRNNKGTPAEKWLLPNDPGTNILIFIMHLFLKERDVRTFSATLIYYMAFQYSKLMHKQIKYCYEDTFKYTLDNLTKTHLFSREKTIPNSLLHLARALQKSFANDIKEWNKDRILAFMTEARTRISQSVKSFAVSYYRNRTAGGGIKTQIEEPDDESNVYQYKVLQKGQKSIDEVAKKITIYKLVDRKALDDSKNVSKVKTSIATIIANELTDKKYFDNIKILLQLYVKELTSVKMICGDEYYTYVKKLMAIKRTTAQLYFKAQVSVLLTDILKSLKLTNSYKNYTSQTQFIINSFLAFYITSIFRNSLC
ncbi:MAG: hypothetical protein ACFFG0_02025 [Candidatus Thorarchaeota archaeon]